MQNTTGWRPDTTNTFTRWSPAQRKQSWTFPELLHCQYHQSTSSRLPQLQIVIQVKDIIISLPCHQGILRKTSRGLSVDQVTVEGIFIKEWISHIWHFVFSILWIYLFVIKAKNDDLRLIKQNFLLLNLFLVWGWTSSLCSRASTAKGHVTPSSHWKLNINMYSWATSIKQFFFVPRQVILEL